MVNYPETTSHKEFFKFTERNDWQKHHEESLRKLVENLTSNVVYWLQPEWGKKTITPMVNAFIPSLLENQRPNARGKIASWWRIGCNRSEWAYQSRALRFSREQLLHKQFSEYIDFAHKYPPPISEDKALKITADDWKKLRLSYDVSQSVFQEQTGLLCVPVSELFFAFEAFSKAICSSKCGVFLKDIIKTDSSVQHNQVWKALKRISASRRENSICSQCEFREVCPSGPEGIIFAGIYVRLIHIRILRDYREDVFFDRITREYLGEAFFTLAIEALKLCDRYLNHSLGGFLHTPVPLEARIANSNNIYVAEFSEKLCKED